VKSAAREHANYERFAGQSEAETFEAHEYLWLPSCILVASLAAKLMAGKPIIQMREAMSMRGRLQVDLAKIAGWVSTLDPKPAKRLKYI
jgi:hypothetical protein